MSEWIGTILSAWTVVVAVVFVAIVVWAWGSGRKQEFDEAARLPLEADDSVSAD